MIQIVKKMSFQKTQAQWRTVFLISTAITSFGAIFYAVFGSGKLQEWAKDQPNESEESHKMEEKLSNETNGEIPESDILLT